MRNPMTNVYEPIFSQEKSIDVAKNFQNVPDHYMVNITLRVFFNVNFTFNVTLDNQIMINYANQTNPNPKESVVLSGSLSHSSKDMNFLIRSSPNFNKMIGFSELTIYLTNNCRLFCRTCSVESPQTCLSCPSLAQLSNGICVCKSKFYLAGLPFIHCAKCHISCQSCRGGSSSECTTCYTSFSLSMNGTCDKASSNF